MEALRQKIRPKHQLLILKCYPKLPAKAPTAIAAEEIKPNSSELSYLLYYASARRSKLEKVGTFLEKKTSGDLYKQRTPAVMVTLQILDAFLGSNEVGGSKDGFGLFAPYVLRILQEVLGHQGVGGEVVDACAPVWRGLCSKQDFALVGGDGGYRVLFERVLAQWAGFAMKKSGAGEKRGSVSDEVRVRKIGLEALRAVVSGGTEGVGEQRQMDVIVNAVLSNLGAGDAGYLALLERRERESEMGRGRPSMQTVRTTRTNDETDPRAAQGSTADADRIAEEEAGSLALRCLKSIYEVDNRAQVRLATSMLLAFVAQQSKGSRHSDRSGTGLAGGPPSGSAWATALVKMVCTWTPVQDRFVVLFTAVETLIRSPIVEQELDKQLVLSHIVGQVLASDINLIGLSIMDILLGLVQHVLLILQIGTTHATLNGGSDVASSDEDLKSPTSGKGVVMDIAKTASPARVQLLAQLRQCIANLANHVYYTDQISDMVAAILLRLKPSANSAHNPSITASAIEDPTSAAQEVASNASLQERPNIDGFFSFDTAREVAMNAVKDIMIVANKNRTGEQDDGVASNRNPVPISIWEGTQWLTRDASPEVRKAYVDAICAWLTLETIKSDAILEERTANPAKNRKENGHGEMARRAVSNASTRNRVNKKGRSTFLQLLHLAIYEEALQKADAPDANGQFAQLHLLLYTLSEKLGMNAIRFGLPMIFRLQEDLRNVSSPVAKTRLGSLVHGYLWSLVTIFNISSSVIGTEIESEISRRKNAGLWLQGIDVPASQVSQIHESSYPIANNAGEDIHPFEHRGALVSRLSEAYTDALIAASPPTSPPASPGRSFSLPFLADSVSNTSSYLMPAPASRPSAAIDSSKTVPAQVVEELNATWSKDILLSNLAAAAPKSLSLSGSRTGPSNTFTTSGSNYPSSSRQQNQLSPPGTGASGGSGNILSENHRHLLAAANTFPLTKSTDGSPTRSGTASSSVRRALTQTRHSKSAHSGTGGQQHRFSSRSPGGARRASASTTGLGGTNTRASSIAGAGGAAGRPTSNAAGSRLEELKRALATGASTSSIIGPGFGIGRLDDEDAYSDSGDESMVDMYAEGFDSASIGGVSGVSERDITSSGAGSSSAAGRGGEKSSLSFSPTGVRKGSTTSASASAVNNHINGTANGGVPQLPDWAAELNAQGGGIHFLNSSSGVGVEDGNGKEEEEAIPNQEARQQMGIPSLNLNPPTPLPVDSDTASRSQDLGQAGGGGSGGSGSPEGYINGNGAGLLGSDHQQQQQQRPLTSGSATGSRRGGGGSRSRSGTVGTNASGIGGRKDFGGLLDSVGSGEGGEGEEGVGASPPY